MIDQCFNPQCKKPLHYLRDGRIFVFGVKNSGNGDASQESHLEHYWLCGDCASRYIVVQDKEKIRLTEKRKLGGVKQVEAARERALAS